MPRRFRRSFRRSGGSRPFRNREWVSFTTGLTYDQPRTNIITFGQTFKSWILDPVLVQDAWDEPTIVRMLLTPEIYLAATSSQATADYRVTIRGGIATWKGDTMNTPGATSLDGLNPDDAGLDWLWWIESHMNHFNLTYLGTTQHDFTGGGGVVNVKSKRKMELGYGLAGAFVCLSDSTPAGVGANIHMSGRILLLNH